MSRILVDSDDPATWPQDFQPLPFADLGSPSNGHQRDLLGQALARVLIAAGAIRADHPTGGPALLLAAEAFCAARTWQPSHQHADGGEYRYLRLAPGKHFDTGAWVAGVIYDAPDGVQRWTDEERWKARFAPITAEL